MNNKLIDTHCHLDTQYFPDAGEIIGRANSAGVDRFVVIGVGKDLTAARAASELAKKRDDVAAVAGIHPHDAKEMTDAMLAELTEIAKRPEVVAVGEIGLDYHYNHSEKSIQQGVFTRLIALAREVKKPIVIHTREAAADTIAILAKEGAKDVGGIIHCFSEDWDFATKAMDLGFDLSFSGIVTFKTRASVHDVAKRAPADRIHVETDSPYLAPIPLRGKKNEPSYIVHTAKRVAELRGTTVEVLAPTLRDNVARRLGLARWV